MAFLAVAYKGKPSRDERKYANEMCWRKTWWFILNGFKLHEALLLLYLYDEVFDLFECFDTAFMC